MSRKEWLAKAKSKEVTVAGETVVMEPRVFSTGTVGWYYNGKMNNGEEQVGFSIYVIGSKQWSD